jgi:hypothetical protein
LSDENHTGCLPHALGTQADSASAAEDQAAAEKVKEIKGLAR